MKPSSLWHFILQSSPSTAYIHIVCCYDDAFHSMTPNNSLPQSNFHSKAYYTNWGKQTLNRSEAYERCSFSRWPFSTEDVLVKVFTHTQYTHIVWDSLIHPRAVALMEYQFLVLWITGFIIQNTQSHDKRCFGYTAIYKQNLVSSE